MTLQNEVQALMEAITESDAALKSCWTTHYSFKSVSQLKSMAKDRGLKGYSKLKKPDLIELLANSH